MPFTMIVTDAGRAALVNAANTGTAPVTIAQVGLTGTAVTPDVTATNLPGEFKRIATLSGDIVADDTIHLIVRDEGADVFTVRSLALYLGDGTLFAIYGQADVLVEKSAQAIMLLAVDIQFADVDAAALTFGNANFLNPPATTEQQGVVELSTLAEAIGGTSTSRVPAEKMVKDAVTAWLDARFGPNNAGIWHPGNDGAGSGLDADLLDGQQGSWYSNIPARLGYNPVQQGTGNGQLAGNVIKIGWSAASRLKATVDVTDQGNFVFDSHISDVWRSSNDGAGSGLDADLLDGQQGSYYTNIPARLGYTPVNKAGDTMTGTLSVSDGAGLAQLKNNGDLKAARTGGTSGVVFLNSSETRYLYSDGVTYSLPGQPLLVNGALSWTAGNDGAGSGLDADLLDGQHGTYYTDIPSRLGFTPVSKSGDSYTNVLSFIDANSQSIAARSTSTPLEVRGNGTGPAVMTFHRPGSFASYLGIDSDNKLKFGGWSSGAVAYDVWHAGSDGSGSGLDADTVDGYQAAALAKVADFAADHSATGYQKLTGGLVMQWGRINLTTRPGYGVVTFPIAFSAAPFYVDSGCATEVGNADAQGNGPLPYGASATNMNVYNAAPGGGNAWWIAIGKV